MNKILFSLLVSAFILTGVSFAQPTPPPAAPVAAAPETIKHPVRHERYPELHKALRKLRGAKQDLQQAAHDYGGHRVKAIEAINHAIEELNDAISSDKK